MPRRILLLLAAVSLAPTLLQAETPIELVRDVVYNELHDHDRHGYWEYSIERHANHQVTDEAYVETVEGPVTRLLRMNGKPLSPAQNLQEEQRLDRLMGSESEQRRIREQHAEDEQRIGRILKMLPDAFLFDYDGTEGECVRLNFRPNPAYNPPTTEARVFHSMGGKIWLNTKWKRLARLDGHILENIDFGFGILGRINKGGWFNLERVAASETDWKTHVLQVHISGRAILFKTIAKDTDELRSGFHPIPRETNLAEARNMVRNTAAVEQSLVASGAVLRTGSGLHTAMSFK